MQSTRSNHEIETIDRPRRERPHRQGNAEMSYLLYPLAIALVTFGSTLAFV